MLIHEDVNSRSLWR